MYFPVVKAGQTNTSDEPRTERSEEMTVSEIAEKIRQIDLEDSRLNLFEIVGSVNISKEAQIIFQFILWDFTRSV